MACNAEKARAGNTVQGGTLDRIFGWPDLQPPGQHRTGRRVDVGRQASVVVVVIARRGRACTVDDDVHGSVVQLTSLFFLPFLGRIYYDD